MKTTEMFRMVAGAVIIYGVVAACGARIDALMKPVIRANATVSGSRLKATYSAGADGSRWYAMGPFWDSARDEYCTPAAFMPDGLKRCVPATGGVSVGHYFKDPLCTILVSGISASLGSGCSSTAFPKYVPQYSDVCTSYIVKLYAISAPYTGPVYYLNDTTCEPSTTTGTNYYELSEVNPTDFVEFTAMTHE